MKHQKRISAPNSWKILRKEYTYTVATRPGPHSKHTSVPLVVLLRDLLHVARTARELKRLLAQKAIVVNGAPRKDYRFNVGLFDVLEIVPTKEQFVILFDERGRIVAKKLDKAKGVLKTHRIKNKTILKKNKTQLNLEDGSNLLVEKGAYKPGDSVIIEKKKVVKHLKLHKGALVFLIGGSNVGLSGVVEEVREIKGTQEDKIIVNIQNKNVETLKKYAYVVEQAW